MCLVTQLCLTLCDPVHCSPPGSFVHGDSPGKNTGVGCPILLWGIFPTQELNPGLLHCRQILYCLSHQGSPWILECVVYPFSRRSSQPRNRMGSPTLQTDSLCLSHQGSPKLLYNHNNKQMLITGFICFTVPIEDNEGMYHEGLLVSFLSITDTGSHNSIPPTFLINSAAQLLHKTLERWSLILSTFNINCIDD